MDMQELKDIIRLLKEEGLSEITVADGDQRVTVRQELRGERVVSPGSLLSTETGLSLAEDQFAVTAPLVGTFYGRPAPDAESFVSAGDAVQRGDIVCIIEAMKVMNEIKAEAPGRVVRVLPEEGAGVEFGQPLILLERL